MKPLSGQQRCRLLERGGWLLLRISGSHRIGKPGERARLSVPVHGNRLLKRGIQRRLMKLAGIDLNDDHP